MHRPRLRLVPGDARVQGMAAFQAGGHTGAPGREAVVAAAVGDVGHKAQRLYLPHRVSARSGGRDGGDEDAVERVMAATGVAGLAARAVPTLSGGERARVMLARVLAADAPVLLADEPTAALDPGHQLRIMALLRAEAAERHRAVVVVLHDLSLAARCCDDLVLLMPDRRVITGDAATVLTPSLLREAYGVSFAVTQAAGTPVVLPQCPTMIQSGD